MRSGSLPAFKGWCCDGWDLINCGRLGLGGKGGELGVGVVPGGSLGARFHQAVLVQEGTGLAWAGDSETQTVGYCLLPLDRESLRKACSVP